MSVRGSGRAVPVAAALAVLGVLGGYAAASALDGAPPSAGEAQPVPAASPSLPVAEEPFTPDIDLPAMPTMPPLVTRTVGTPPTRWSLSAPAQWAPAVKTFGETRFVPPGNTFGGYGLRVTLVDEDRTPAEMADAEIAALETSYDDVEVLQRGTEAMMVSFRSEPQGWRRFNFFRWVTPPGSDRAGLELVVSGRERDLPGMRSLFVRASASVRLTP